VRIAVAATVVGALALLALSRAAAQGFAMGGLAGIITHWLMARQLERLATRQSAGLQSAVLGVSFVRLAIYGVVLARAHYIDPETHHGLLAAAAGVFVMTAVLIVLGITGLDLKKRGE